MEQFLHAFKKWHIIGKFRNNRIVRSRMRKLKIKIFSPRKMDGCTIHSFSCVPFQSSQHCCCIKVQPQVSFPLKHAVIIRRQKSMTVCTALLGPGLWLLHTGKLVCALLVTLSLGKRVFLAQDKLGSYLLALLLIHCVICDCSHLFLGL